MENKKKRLTEPANAGSGGFERVSADYRASAENSIQRMARAGMIEEAAALAQEIGSPFNKEAARSRWRTNPFGPRENITIEDPVRVRYDQTPPPRTSIEGKRLRQVRQLEEIVWMLSTGQIGPEDIKDYPIPVDTGNIEMDHEMNHWNNMLSYKQFPVKTIRRIYEKAIDVLNQMDYAEGVHENTRVQSGGQRESSQRDPRRGPGPS